MRLDVDVGAIIWPGNTTNKPKGYMIPTKLKVIIIIFSYLRKEHRDLQPE